MHCTDIDHLLRDLAGTLSAVLDHRITLSVDVPTGLRGDCHPQMLEEVLVQAIRRAVAALPDGGTLQLSALVGQPLADAHPGAPDGCVTVSVESAPADGITTRTWSRHCIPRVL